MAASAVARSTPSISKRIFPGRITATHSSGAPLPLPIRVSAGFLVIGLSGNKRIHTLPPRLMERVMATRAASICRDVIHAHSMALRPNSPKEMADPRQALPHMRPRCCFLNLTFFGIIMAVCPQFLNGSRPKRPASVRQPAWSRGPPQLPDGPPVSGRAAAATSTAAESASPDALPDAADRSARSAPPDPTLRAAEACAPADDRGVRRHGLRHDPGVRDDHPYHPGGRANRALVPDRAADCAAW